MYYDMNVDCLWIIVAAENEVVRHKMDYYVLEDSIGCRKDALWVCHIHTLSRLLYLEEKYCISIIVAAKTKSSVANLITIK